MFLAGIILLIFLAVKRDWQAILVSLWLPSVALFLAVALPWYVAVQHRNPEFFRVFILEHNLGRFGQDLYHHHQPFWFYLPVLLVALMPWTLWWILAVVEKVRLTWSRKEEALATPADSWQLFLLIWLLVPVLFFSASHSKLPGYILPSIPAGTLLVAEYLRGRQRGTMKNSHWLGLHAVLCGTLVFVALAAPGIQLNHRLAPGTGTYLAVGASVIIMLGIAVVLLRSGLRMLRPATMIPIVIGVAALLRLAAPVIDATQSARPVAQSIQSFSHEAVPVALFHANRQTEYGLEFYLNRPTQRYENGLVPDDGHVLVAAQGSAAQFSDVLRGRRLSFLTSIPAQKLDLYWVGPVD
jgi:4-amino-4-deoxy-L-arabinose transferase-like glycosyltransferase